MTCKLQTQLNQKETMLISLLFPFQAQSNNLVHPVAMICFTVGSKFDATTLRPCVPARP